MGPNSSDLAQNLTPGVFFHEDSESGLRMGGFRGKNLHFSQKLAMELAMVGVLFPPILGVMGPGDQRPADGRLVGHARRA